jgi:integrase
MKIHTVYQSKRKKPYIARWYEGKRQRNRFFATESSRAEFIEQFNKLSERQDPSLHELAPHQLIRWQQAMAIAPEADPVEVFRFWIRAQKEKLKVEERRLEVALADYIRSMERVGRNHSYIGHVRRALADLRDELGNKLVRDISVEELTDHLFGLPYSPVTLKNRRTYLYGAFAWWKQQGWVNQNTVKKVECPKVQDKEPGILTVDETRRLFKANEKLDPEICGLLALGAFAGMRTSAISRIDYSEIDFTQRGILTPAEKTKKHRRQWIEDLPDNLWAWLKRTPPEAFKMTHRQMLHRRSMAMKRAGLLIEADDISRDNAKRDRQGLGSVDLKPKAPPKNALRHSFVTYHVALHRNPGKTALIVSHRDQDCLYRHYLGIANQQDAKEYFKIFPRG